MLLLITSVLIIFILVFTFVKNSKYILNSLIILEAIMLFSMVFMIVSLSWILESNYMFIMLMTFMACEAALGLSLLVTFVRLRGNNLINSLSINCW
uniref:NADH dehydrogenase subunit 4L n=1 Tax=Bathyomphalus contortus TaxID=419017 RepID=A0A7D6W3K5_9GAST|nr:NADH dehydrogenase subunit 4L [Bathyomphalus contortus]